jgi:hypothetical protein
VDEQNRIISEYDIWIGQCISADQNRANTGKTTGPMKSLGDVPPTHSPAPPAGEGAAKKKAEDPKAGNIARNLNQLELGPTSGKCPL